MSERITESAPCMARSSLVVNFRISYTRQLATKMFFVTMSRQHYLLTICIELVELTNSVSVSLSDDKIQITILILRRGALSKHV